MRDAKVDWQLNSYGGAVHSFTQKNASRKGQAEYSESATKRARKAMYSFFKEIFADA